ncbi:MAG: DUF4230 domain-containing protein [Chloroflexales bacterium]|jgi:Protein of unknown function (DUF4230)
MQSDSPRTAVRSPVLPWILLILIIGGGGVYFFRTQIADILRPLPPPATSTPISGQGILKRIQALNNLESAAFHLEAVISKEQAGTWWKGWQDGQSALFVANGSVVAGINLSRLTADDVRVSTDGKTVRITLPPAEILNVSVTDLNAVDTKTGILGLIKLDEGLRQQAMQDARSRLQTIACESGILKTATENSTHDIERLFTLMDGIEVTVSAAPAAPCQAPATP